MAAETARPAWPFGRSGVRPLNGTAAARFAVAASWLSILCTITIGLLGPSAMVPALPGPAWHPPYSLGLAPDGHLVIALAAAAIVLGAAGLATGLLAAERLPGARTLVAAGCAAAAVLAFLPPSGSADHLNYAAYGRIAVLGHDPYVTVPADLPGDPVTGAVEEWRNTPSVYGPVATALQTLAGHIGGESVRLTVFVLALANAAAFIATGLFLHHATRGDRGRQRRAALLWIANPLLIYQLAAGMHLDTLAIAFAVAGLVACAGVPLGLGVAVKVTAGLVAPGLAWELRRRPARLALVVVTATATVLVAYRLAGPHALDQVLNASRSISLATPWKLVQRALQALFGPGAYRPWIQAGSLALLASLAGLLLRRLLARDRAARASGPAGAVGPSGAPEAAGPLGAAGAAEPSRPVDRSSGAEGPGDPAGSALPPATAVAGTPAAVPYREGAAVALALTAAWLFAAPYVLPWYAGLAFALLALVPASALEAFLVAHLTALSLGYLPARQHGQPADLGWLVSVVREWAVPCALIPLTIGLLWWAARAGARAPRPRA